jgi:lysophospholipase L1-like esterase
VLRNSYTPAKGFRLSATTKKLTLAAVSFVLACVIAEAILRAIDYGRLAPELNFGVNTGLAFEQGRFLHDPDLFWKMPPQRRDAEINAVQRDRPLPPKGSRRRVLVLGDSCSRLFLRGLPYSALLADSLDATEVFNAAVPGYTVWQGRAWWHEQLSGGGFDAAVVYFGWNDHWRSTGTTDPEYAGWQAGTSLRLARLFRRRADVAPLRLPLEAYRATLADLVRDLQRAGVRPVLVAPPSNLTRESRQRLLQTGYLSAGDDAVALHRQYIDALREVADETGAEVLDAARIFAALDRPTDLLLRDGIHLTDLGHRVMAAILAPVLAADPGTAPGTRALTRRAAAVIAAVPVATEG